jgi:NitT/TauT family transport system ATP-binding protein
MMGVAPSTTAPATDVEAHQSDVATSRAIIQAVNVSKVYQSSDGEKIAALTSLNLEVSENEFLVIVGPSGCGKSTLLKLIVGLLPVTDGTIYFHGQPVRGPRTDVGMVFQEPVLLPWRTVRQNVLFPIEILRRKDRDYVEESDRLLTLVGLSGFQDKMPYELSGGMQQRAAICRALIHDPSVLIMDEPFGALDAMTRDEMGAELLRIWQHRRKTVIFVTHSIREAVWLADRVVVMTARPAKIADIIKIDFERPRTDKMQFLPQFGRYVEEIGDIVAGRRAKGLLCQD